MASAVPDAKRVGRQMGCENKGREAEVRLGSGYKPHCRLGARALAPAEPHSSLALGVIAARLLLALEGGG